ncbi:MAG: type II secretory pathway, pseudopilin PulG, general secretion pathway protein G [candidate division NC10 bacterium CSP1-5]|nr:MAG: type II secretory pathway, pseudopilin PulG, general secretion pathway protein G [candidate division NC10 bacterium CSP1-5]
MGIGLRHEGSFDTRGFTLVELLITLTVLGVLASVAMPLVEVTVKRTREIELRRGLREIREGIDRFKVDYDKARQNARDAREIFKARVSSDRSGYPLTLEELVETKTLRRIPKDPMSTEGRWVIRSYSDSLDTTLTDRRDIYDVRSASTATAMDGSRYETW